MAPKDDIYENFEAEERAAALSRSLMREADKRAAGDPVRLALDVLLVEMARKRAVAEGLSCVQTIEDETEQRFSMAAE